MPKLLSAMFPQSHASDMGTVPTGMLHISISLALMETSQGRFDLDGKWDSSLGGENVSVSP